MTLISINASLSLNCVSDASALEDSFLLRGVPASGIGPDGTVYQTAYACQGSQLNISCPRADEVIQVVRANYGRFSVAICNEDGRTDFSVNCLATNSMNCLLYTSPSPRDS